MGYPGREPDPSNMAPGRKTDWTDVPDRPYRGKPPVQLPATRKEHGEDVPLDPATVAWWRAHSRMPHCSLWSETDWEFAVQTAVLVDMLHNGQHTVATEIRNRLKIMGATYDARIAMRIRYVKPEPKKTAKTLAAEAAAPNAASIDPRRLRAVS